MNVMLRSSSLPGSYDPITLDPIPGAASHADVSDDKRVWTFKLRPEARWTNGDPVTAHDYVFSWRRMFEEPGEYTYLFDTSGIAEGATLGFRVRALDVGVLPGHRPGRLGIWRRAIARTRSQNSGPQSPMIARHSSTRSPGRMVLRSSSTVTGRAGSVMSSPIIQVFASIVQPRAWRNVRRRRPRHESRSYVGPALPRR